MGALPKTRDEAHLQKACCVTVHWVCSATLCMPGAALRRHRPVPTFGAATSSARMPCPIRPCAPAVPAAQAEDESANTPMPELQHNLQLLVDLAEADIQKLDAKLRHEQDTAALLAREKHRLEDEVRGWGGGGAGALVFVCDCACAVWVVGADARAAGLQEIFGYWLRARSRVAPACVRWMLVVR